MFVGCIFNCFKIVLETRHLETIVAAPRSSWESGEWLDVQTAASLAQRSPSGSLQPVGTPNVLYEMGISENQKWSCSVWTIHIFRLVLLIPLRLKHYATSQRQQLLKTKNLTSSKGWGYAYLLQKDYFPITVHLWRGHAKELIFFIVLLPMALIRSEPMTSANELIAETDNNK